MIMKIGLLYNVNSLSEKFLFHGLEQGFHGLGILAEGFTPFKKYSHLLIHESRYDFHKGMIEKHKNLGQKIIVYTPNKDCKIDEIIVSSNNKTKHHFIDLGAAYHPLLPKKKISKVCWIGDSKEFGSGKEFDYFEDMQNWFRITDINSFPFELHTFSDASSFSNLYKYAIQYKRFNEFSLDTNSIVISSNLNDYITLECAVRGIPCLQVENKNSNKILTEFASDAPDHLKEFCREFKSVKDVIDTIELLKITEGFFDPLISHLRSKVLKQKLLSQSAVEYAELFNAL